MPYFGVLRRKIRSRRNVKGTFYSLISHAEGASTTEATMLMT